MLMALRRVHTTSDIVAFGLLGGVVPGVERCCQGLEHRRSSGAGYIGQPLHRPASAIEDRR